MRTLTFRRDEAGIAMPLVLIIMLVLMVVATTVFANAVGENRATGTEQRFESTIHVAESGAEAGLARLAEDPTWSYGMEFAGGSVDDERAWAVAQADAAPDDVVVPVPGGESVVVRPENATALYSVGYLPSRSDPREVRVVRVGLTAEPDRNPFEFDGDHAILARGDISTGASANWGVRRIGGATHVSVHTKSDLETKANKDQIEGTGYAEGEATCGSTDCVAPAPPVELPEIAAIAAYKTPAAEEVRRDGDWIDLCPDGTARLGTASGSPTTEPCTGDPAGSVPASFSGSTWNVNGPTSAAAATVFYAHGADIHMKNGQWNFYGGAVAARVDGVGGNVDLGNANFHFYTGDATDEGAFWNIAILADGWVESQGNASMYGDDVSGSYVLAQEDVRWRGTVQSEYLAFILNGAYSVNGGGNGSLYWNNGSGIDLGDGGGNTPTVDVANWVELTP